MPAISVIIPVYNVRKYLNRCLDSVLFQRFKDIEIICIDDGSTDGCSDILKSYVQRDERIKIISTINQGLSVARNMGLSQATGESIFFLDADDAIHPACLGILWTVLNDTHADMVHCQFENSDGVSRRYQDINTHQIKYKLTQAYCFTGKRSMGFNVWSNLYKRQLLDNVEFIEGIHFEDVPFLLTVLSRHPKIAVLDEKLYFYTINENSISHKPINPKQIFDYYTGLKHIYHVYCQNNLWTELRHLKHTFIPIILKQQLNRCQRSDKKMQSDMYYAFAQELHYLKAKGLLGWRGHKIGRYLTYLKLIKEYL
jgi:glycosyltransferase involved in cell wall biosynthesis